MYTVDKYTGKKLLKSPLRLIGSKGFVRDTLYQLFPDNYNVYIEPFAGTAGVAMGAPKVEHEIINDICEVIPHFFLMVKAYTEDFWDLFQMELGSYLAMEAAGIAELAFKNYRVRSTWRDNRSSLFFYLVNKTCVNGIWRLNKKGLCNSSFCKKVKGRGWMTREWYDAVVERIGEWEIHQNPYQDILKLAKKSAVCNNVFVFLDPPYEHKSAKNKTGAVTTYNGVKFLEKDFIELEGCLRSAKYKWLMTVNDSPFIRQLFRDYCIVPWKVYWRVSKKVSSRGLKDELLIANYDIETKFSSLS